MGPHARRTALLGAGALLLLVLTAPRPREAWTLLTHPAAATDVTGPLVAAVALAAWVLSVWLVLTVVLVLAARAPGLVGRIAAVVARRAAPAAVRRSLELALGLSVTLGGFAAPAATAAPLAPADATAPSSAVDALVPDLDWPQTPAAAPVPAPGPRAATAPAVAASAQVVVRPGDSLWALAETHLRRTGTAAPTDRQIALAWPRWWAANREVIGDDPDLILPGTVLRPPSS